MARRIRNYEVVSELGVGHFGAVYLAVGEVPARGRIPGKRRLVAIKKLKNTADRESVELLLQEFSLLEQVKHRCIVRVFEYLEDENAVVMEFIHGVTLRTVLEELDKAHEQVFTEAAVEIGCEIADALYQAYTTPGDNGEPLQLVHRDLKPANIMLTPTGEVKLLDFGLARVDNADFARDNPERIRGTPIYMAPEQARGGGIDHRSDLFGLGLILYELLMGEAAYRVPVDAADPLAAIFQDISSGNLVEPCGRLEGRLPGHGPVITRMLRPRPEDRYRNGHDVMVDLRRQLYRDRGAYLEEFCEFFFGSIHDIGEPPTLESLPSTPRGRTEQPSIAERLRKSMANNQMALDQLSRPAPPPSTRPAPPAGRRVTPPRGTGTATVRPVGGRSPNETGMLRMVPLSSDGVSSNAEPDATAFFAISAPKSRATPAAAPPPPNAFGGPPPPAFGSGAPPPPVAFGGRGAPPPPSFGGGAPPPPSPVGPPAQSISYGQGIGVGNVAGVAQGPVAQAGNMGGGGAPPNTPFPVSGGMPDNPTHREEGRTRSYQIFAIIFAAFAMICIACVSIVFWVLTHQDTDVPEPDRPPVAANTPAEPTAEPEFPEPEPEPEPDRPERPYRPPVTGGTTTPKPPTTPPVPSGKATVVLKGGPAYNKIEVNCSDGGSSRASLRSGRGTVEVKGSDCKLTFKGPGAPIAGGRIRGGQSKNCTMNGAIITCS